MATFAAFLLVYVIGGLTFVPICLAAAVYLALLACPQRLHQQHDRQSSDELRDHALADIPPELSARSSEPDVAAGYFAVCREYVPGGVNGKPPERTTPAGAVVGVESPSVYQTMYRTIFDRNRNQGPSMEGAKNGKAQKKARNVFFVVLRHGHLILFDDVEQVEVRYVISLAHRIVDVYAGGDAIPEGELWIKRNCIRLRRAQHAADSETESRPFYLFSENSSEKEDFYFALLRNQERQTGMPISPPLHFDQPHVVKLVQQLHASEETLQTRWINALAGRVFLALYKTPNVEEFIRTKITKKISRVAKPAFIQSITIQRIDMGDSAPMITNPKLRELTLDGDMTAEADVKYNGNFRLEIAAVARIDLGARFKARYVNMVLAGILKKLEGHVLIRVKPPPSNRLWLTFEHPPKMEMTIEPIVSSRQITYGMILRAIENRIREVVTETLVLPNWDDMPFFDTLAQPLRGGIWEDATKAPVSPDVAPEPSADDTSLDDGSTLHEEPAVSHLVRKDEKTMSMPNLRESDASSLKSRKSVKSVVSVNAAGEGASASGVEVRASASKPRSMRSGSFASIARPVVAQDTAVVEAQKSPQKLQHDAITAMKDISSRSVPTSPVESPVGSPAVPAGPLAEASAHGALKHNVRHKTGDKPHSSKHKTADDEAEVRPSTVQKEAEKAQESRERGPSFGRSEDEGESFTDLFGEFVHSHTEPISRPEPAAFSVNSEQSSLYSQATDSTAHSDQSAKSSLSSRKTSLSEKRQILNMSLNSATTAAKKWFASRQQQSGAPHFTSNPSHPSPSFAASSPSASTTGTPARSSSPTRDQQQQQQPSLWSQSTHTDTKSSQQAQDYHHHQQHDRVPSTPLSSISSSAKAATTPSSVSPPKNSQPDNHTRRPPSSSRSSSISSVPMGRGQPLPPPGVPLPPPAKPENKWVQGSAQLLGLAKRKPVPSSAASSASPSGGGSTNGNSGGGNNNGHGFGPAHGDQHHDNNGHPGWGDGAAAATDLQVPAATAAPVGIVYTDSSLAAPRGHSRTTSSSSSLGGSGGGNNGGLKESEEAITSLASSSTATITATNHHDDHNSRQDQHPQRQHQRKQSNSSSFSSSSASHHNHNHSASASELSPPPLPPRRKKNNRRQHHSAAGGNDEPQLLVVAAPLVESDADASSAPPTPVIPEKKKNERDGGEVGEEGGSGMETGGEGEGDGQGERLEGSVFDLELDDGDSGEPTAATADSPSGSGSSSSSPPAFASSSSADDAAAAVAAQTSPPPTATPPRQQPPEARARPPPALSFADMDLPPSASPPQKSDTDADENGGDDAHGKGRNNRRSSGQNKGKNGWFTSPSVSSRLDELPEHRR